MYLWFISWCFKHLGQMVAWYGIREVVLRCVGFNLLDLYIFCFVCLCDCSHLVQNDLDLIILLVWFSYIYIKLLEILGSCYKCLEKMIQVSTTKIIWSNLFFIYAGNNCNPSNEGTKFSMTLMKKWKFYDSCLQINGSLWINNVKRS